MVQGRVRAGDKVLVMPLEDPATAAKLERNGAPARAARAGDNTEVQQQQQQQQQFETCFNMNTHFLVFDSAWWGEVGFVQRCSSSSSSSLQRVSNISTRFLAFGSFMVGVGLVLNT